MVPAPVTNGSRQPATIVIADDDPNIRDLLHATLTGSGYCVLAASNGRHAIELLRTERSRLLITDLFMPDQEGIETIVAAKKEFPGLRIVAMSGSVGTPYLTVAKQVGAHAILKKPFDAAMVLEIIQRVLASSTLASTIVATSQAER